MDKKLEFNHSSFLFYDRCMKLIFLDIDGVMNSATGTGPYIADMEVSKLALLKKIIAETQSEGIVLISDRRYSSVYMNQFIEALDQFEIFMVGETRRPKDFEEDIDDNRGKQIKDYLENSNEYIDRIVILDDNDEGISQYFDEEFIQVNRFYGLTNEVCDKIKKVLL